MRDARLIPKNLNALAEHLSAFCSTHPLDEKVLVAPSPSVGHQVTEALVRSGTPWVNLRVETVRTLAHSLVGVELASDGWRVPSQAQSLALVEQACAEVLTEDSYFGKLRTRPTIRPSRFPDEAWESPTNRSRNRGVVVGRVLKDQPGLHRAFQSTLRDLWQAGIHPDDLPDQAFETSAKSNELRAILKSHDALLERLQFIDEADVIRKAIEKLSNSPDLTPVGRHYLIPEDLDLSGLEREFLEELARESLHTLTVDRFENWQPTSETVRLFHALGEENEVREVFRRLLEEGIPLDNMEIVYTSAEPYLPLLYELSAQYEITGTFVKGIPASFTRPSQAILGYLQWIAGDYDANILRSHVSAGRIEFAAVIQDEDPPSAARAASVLREAGIGWGRDRHLSCLNGLITRYESELVDSEGEDAEESEARRGVRQRNLSAARVVRNWVERVLHFTPASNPDGRVSLPEMAAGAATFVGEFARVAGELDGIAAKALREILTELSSLPEVWLPVGEAVERLAEAVKSTHVNSSTPRPGSLHVSHYRNGGYSGRERTFVLGLGESHYPGTSLQDPVLLDEERQEINSSIDPRSLPLLADRPAENREVMELCLARLRGQITLSYANRDLLDDREQFPSALLLNIHRRVSGNDAADYTHLQEALGSPAGFIPPGVAALDDTEWWLREIRNVGVSNEDLAACVRSVYPWLQEGHAAEQERQSVQFTRFDGKLEAVMRDDTPEVAACAENLLREEGRPAEERDEVLRLVTGLRESDLWRRALKAERRLVEVPFAAKVASADLGITGGPEETILHGTIDLVFRERDHWIIVDYKSDTVRDNLEALVAYYTPQVNLYRKHWEELTREPAKAGLFFIGPMELHWGASGEE